MQTCAAADLDEALLAIKTDGPFDLVLLDYKMPGMNGLAGLQRALAAEGGQRGDGEASPWKRKVQAAIP